MQVHRWRLRRVAGWLAPVALLILLVSLMGSAYRDSAGDLTFLSDDAYRNVVVADMMAREHVYGAIPGQPIPLFQDLLWRMGAAALTMVVGDGMTVVMWLSILFAVLALVQITRLINLIFPFPLYGYLAAGLVVLGPGLLSATYAGDGTTFGMYLVLLAVLRHNQDYAKNGRGLPFASAVLIGLAMWLRIEFVAVWLALWIHTLISAYLPAERKPSPGVALFRGLNGVLIAALFMLPLLAWNMHMLKVPWPRLPHVPMAADAVAGSGGVSIAFAWMRVGWYEAYGVFRAVALPGGFWGSLFYLLGAVVLVVDRVRLKEDRPYLMLLILPWSLPFAYGLLYPFTGDHSMMMVIKSMWAFGWLVAAYGLVRLPFLCEAWVREKWPSIPETRVFQAWWGACSFFLVVSAFLSLGGETRANKRAVAELEDARQVIMRAMDEHMLSRDRFMSDQPGWLAWRHGMSVVDARGEWTPGMLAYVARQGGIDPDRVLPYLEKMTPPPGVMILRDPRYYPLVRILPEAEIIASPDDSEAVNPQLMAIGTWPGVL